MTGIKPGNPASIVFFKGIAMQIHTGRYDTCARRSPRLGRFIRSEADSLAARKESLDFEFPAHAKQIPPDKMRFLAYRSLLDKICNPASGIGEVSE
jgi:hypothetical protein